MSDGPESGKHAEAVIVSRGRERTRHCQAALFRRIASATGNLVLTLVEHGERVVATAEELERLLADLAEARFTDGAGMPAWLPAARVIQEEFRNADLMSVEIAKLDGNTWQRAAPSMTRAVRRLIVASSGNRSRWMGRRKPFPPVRMPRDDSHVDSQRSHMAWPNVSTNGSMRWCNTVTERPRVDRGV